jgi:hypothetical protein
LLFLTENYRQRLANQVFERNFIKFHMWDNWIAASTSARRSAQQTLYYCGFTRCYFSASDELLYICEQSVPQSLAILQ